MGDNEYLVELEELEKPVSKSRTRSILKKTNSSYNISKKLEEYN